MMRSKFWFDLRVAVPLQDNGIMRRFSWKVGDAGAIDNQSNIVGAKGSRTSLAWSTSAVHQRIPRFTQARLVQMKKQRGFCE